MVTRTPLNGQKTHPLTEHSYSALRRLASGPVRRFEINPGVFNRLVREDLCELEIATQLIKITDAGRAVLAAKDK